MKKRWLVRALVIVAAGLLAVPLIVYLTFGHRPLQAYIAKLRAKGEKVTFSERQATLSTKTNTSLAALTNAVLKLGELPAATTNIGAMHYVEGGRAEIAWKLSNPPWAPFGHDASWSTWSGASKRIAELAKPLAALRQAARQPPVNGGPRTDSFQTVTPSRTVRSVASWLAFAALVDLHEGRQQEALSEIEALAGVANLHREEYSMVSAMLRVATAHLGLQVTWEATQAAGWNEAQLLALQGAWESVNLLDGLERGLEAERTMGMESFNRWVAEKQQASQTEGNASSDRAAEPVVVKFALQKVIGPVYKATVIDNDFLFAIRNGQARVEMVRSLRANRSLPEVLLSLRNVDARLDAKGHSIFKFFYLVSAVSTPNFKPAFVTATQTETERRLAITAIALKRFQLKKGRPAPSLDALVPEFIATVPFDCMSGRPLRYLPHPDQTFALYSAGMDGEDNGGDPSPGASGGKTGLWEGRDALWPTAADQKPVRSQPQISQAPLRPDSGANAIRSHPSL
jgi:hypothetical protein